MKFIVAILALLIGSWVCLAGNGPSSEGRPTPPISSPENPKNAGVATENSKPAEVPAPDKEKKKYSKPDKVPAPGK